MKKTSVCIIFTQASIGIDNSRCHSYNQVVHSFRKPFKREINILPTGIHFIYIQQGKYKKTIELIRFFLSIYTCVKKKAVYILYMMMILKCAVQKSAIRVSVYRTSACVS